MKNVNHKRKAIDILLVHAPIDKKYLDVNVVYAPPLALLSIQGYLENNGINETIKIIDGTISSQEEIIDIINAEKPRIIGVSTQLLSYKNTIEIALAGKKCNSTIILGGHQASHLSEEIITNRKGIIDVVIVDNGEIPFLKLCQGIKYEDIEGITYFDKEKNRVIKNNACPIHIDESSYYAKVDFDYSIYRKKYIIKERPIITNNYRRIVSHKGCGYRYKSRCEFCGRYGNKVSYISPVKYWQLFNDYNLDEKDFVFDVGDDFLFNQKWLSELVAQKDKSFNKDVKIGIFGRIDEIDKTTIDLIKKIGVFDITAGFESGDKTVIKSANKGIYDTTYYIRQTELLLRNGIFVTPSYVLGLKGETEQSLANTLKQAEKVKSVTKVITGYPPHEIVANLVEPLPGSPAFSMLQKYFPKKYLKQDVLEMEDLQKDYFSIVHNLNSEKEYYLFRKLLAEYGKEINKLVGVYDTEGWLRDER